MPAVREVFLDCRRRKWYIVIIKQKGENPVKRYVTISFVSLMALGLTGCGSGGKKGIFAAVLLILLGAALLGFAILRTRSFYAYCRVQRRKGRKVPKTMDVFTWGTYGIAGILLLIGLIIVCVPGKETEPEEVPETIPVETTEPVKRLAAQSTGDTDPDNWKIRWEIFENGKIRHSYDRKEEIFFEDPEDYFALPGVSTFRGNNYRNNPAYGTAVVEEKILTAAWTHETGVIEGGTWSGNGWTGQPLIVSWDAETRQIMNLYPEKKDKETLTEVIYASLDGVVYFLDLEDGSQTRDPLDIGMCFKGAGTLDPRGYPILYVGSGDENAQGQRPRMYVISLIDGKILYQYGHEDDLAYRIDNEKWCAFDSAPLIHAETDTLIWPGENGNLYTIKLNTVYDKTAGTLSVSPDEPVLTRYTTGRTNTETYWSGYEASANIVDNFLYVSENGGMFFCIDLNTMELVWAQDTKDDSNSTPVFQQVNETEGYIYTAPSLHWTQDSNAQGTISIYKLDAVSGEIIWEKPYAVHTVNGVSGGVQSTPLLGKPGTNLDGMIYYAIARTNTVDAGTLVALDTETGEERWRLDMENYAWSSPVGVYDAQGNGYVVLCDSQGTAHFIDGATGEVCDTLYLGGLVEASPAVYENTMVVGTRMKQIYGIRIK